MSKRRSIRNKVKSLKINYLQGCKLLLFGFGKCMKKGRNPKVSTRLKKVLLKLLCYSTINFCVWVEVVPITLM